MLEQKDTKILYQLDLDARQSLPQIGRKVGLSPEVVFHRLKNLERRGIIEQYYAVIDPSTIGYKAYRVYVKTQDLSLAQEDALLAWLVQNPRTWWVLSVEGRYDKDFFLWVKDDYEFEREWRQFSEQFRPHINEKLIQLYTRLHHFHRAYLLGKRQDEEPAQVLLSTARVDVDDADRLILQGLAGNARLPLIEISRRAGIAAKNVAYRIRRLERMKVILGYRAKLNLERIGYRYYKIEVNLRDFNALPALHTFATMHPNITYVNEVIGLADFDADVEIPSEQDLLALLTQIRRQFGPAIRDISYLTIRTVHKISYFPET